MGRAFRDPEHGRSVGPRAPQPARGPTAWASAVGNRAVQRLARQTPEKSKGEQDARPTPDEVLERFQVQEDELQKWRPKAFGTLTIPFTEEHDITVTEGKLLDDLTWRRGLAGLRTFRQITEEAQRLAEQQYPDPATIPTYVARDWEQLWKSTGGHRDAFRHCYLTARLAKAFGLLWTRRLMTAHEAKPLNLASVEAMDLYNNEIGLELGRDNAQASSDELVRLAMRAADDGKLIVIGTDGKLAWSNTVAVWEHGLPADERREGRIPLPPGKIETY